MKTWLTSLSLALLGTGVSLSFAVAAKPAEKTAAERGREAIFHRSLNPPAWPYKAYETVWKQWGLTEKPADFARAFRERYGLHEAPFDNHGLPLGLNESSGFLGKGITNNCLLCHAGTIAGQTIIGMGNASVDLQGLFMELTRANGYQFEFPYQFSNVRGTIDPVSPISFLIAFRDSELNVTKPVPLPYARNLCSDPPAWWLLKKKKTRHWTGNIDARSNRVDMVTLLAPQNTATYIKKMEQTFIDISAFVHSVEAPKYPFAIDEGLAERGRGLFVKTCSRCHGTYGPDGQYPNKIVPLDTLGTDPLLAEALTPQLEERFNQSWFARESGPDGKPYRALTHKGYQAPPLDGVWATAPYFHNSSAPTVYDVLNSKARPKLFTRSYRTGREDYDAVKLGWKITVLEQSPSTSLSPFEQRKIYDSTRPGQSNAGHTFGDDFTEEERMAVIEYLKTL